MPATLYSICGLSLVHILHDTSWMLAICFSNVFPQFLICATHRPNILSILLILAVWNFSDGYFDTGPSSNTSFVGIEEIEKMEEGSTEIGRQRSKKTAHGAGLICSRSTSRSTGGGGRSTGPVDWRARACTGWSGRPGPVDRLKWPRSRVGAVDRAGRPWLWSVDRPVDRRTRLEFPFRIRIPFLIGIESNLGFHKFRDSVAINRG